MKKIVLLKKSSNYYNSMDSAINFIGKGLSCPIPNIFRFENPSYGFNVGEETYITPDLNSSKTDKYVIKEDLISTFLETYPIVFVGVVGNKADLYNKNGIYQSNVMLKNISLYAITSDGQFIDLVRKLKFDTKNENMIFYPLCSYVSFKDCDVMYCVLNDELMTIEKFNEEASSKTDFAHYLIDPITGTLKNELFDFSIKENDILRIKNTLLVPKEKNEINFKIFKDHYGLILQENIVDLINVKTNGIYSISSNNIKVNVLEEFTVLNVTIDLHDLFKYSIKAEKLEFDFLIIRR